MSDSTNKSHATGDSIVPQKLQEKLPKGVEDAVPNSIHDTSSKTGSSHATSDSAVPKVCCMMRERSMVAIADVLANHR